MLLNAKVKCGFRVYRERENNIYCNFEDDKLYKSQSEENVIW